MKPWSRDAGSEPSGILYGRTTPRAPTNLKLGPGPLLASTVPVAWEEEAAGAGEATVAGYRVSWVAEETGAEGHVTCNAQAKEVTVPGRGHAPTVGCEALNTHWQVGPG